MKTLLQTYHKRLEKYRQAKLKKSERLSDLIAAWCGSWSFLLLHLIGFLLWLAFGLNFNFLTLVVSFEAILLINILLMAQNRQARGDELRDEADYQADKHSADKMDELIELFKKSK